MLCAPPFPAASSATTELARSGGRRLNRPSPPRSTSLRGSRRRLSQAPATSELSDFNHVDGSTRDQQREETVGGRERNDFEHGLRGPNVVHSKLHQDREHD